MRILTPEFYTRMVHYTSLAEAIDRECIFTDEKNRTLWLCRPHLLPPLLPDRSPSPNEDNSLPRNGRGFLDELRWTILRKLRCAPADPAYSMTPKSSSFHVDDIRSRPYSEIDQHVRRFSSATMASEYRRTVSKTFFAQRYCFGFVEAVTLLDLCVRVVLCFLGAVQLKYSILGSNGLGLLECVNGLVTRKDWMPCFGNVEAIDWRWFSSSAIMVFACHVYELSKGYR